MRILGLLKGIDVHALDPLHRVLLVTDGTLTETLEAIFLEPIELVRVGQRQVAANASHALLQPQDGETVVERKILLRGSRSRTNYVYAESLIAADRLGPEFRRGLVESDIPLGRLWIEQRLETFKEFLDMRCETGTAVPAEFGAEGAALLVRTYRVHSAGRPVFVITEYFPSTFVQPTC
jgi:chorismate-pyruvate lyase